MSPAKDRERDTTDRGENGTPPPSPISLGSFYLDALPPSIGVSCPPAAAVTKLADLSPTSIMASSSFRDSINSLGWSRRQEAPITTSQQSSGLLASLQNLNPFQDRGYTILPTSEAPGAPLPAPSRREEEEGWFVRESSLFTLSHRLHGAPSCALPPPPSSVFLAPLQAKHVHCISSSHLGCCM